jgi:hypothetical protein
MGSSTTTQAASPHLDHNLWGRFSALLGLWNKRKGWCVRASDACDRKYTVWLSDYFKKPFHIASLDPLL